jgi:UDP-2-acetamido-2-deoxy-ribo-hexuluronate aminotransferase
MQFIDLNKQYIKYKKEINQAIQRVLDSGCFILGEEVSSLEQELADFVGVKYALGVASGTDSLFIALMALGIGKGDEVITTPFTFISTAEVIALVGATPVFVDIEEESFNIDPLKIEKAITTKTKAIMPVSLFGQMADYSAINAIAKKYNLPVIEDGAQSFGATQNQHLSCGVTLIGSTSFFPAKPLGCYGDGGALFTNDAALYEKMKKMRIHGSEKKNYHTCLGITGRLDTLQAAILRVKLKYFKEEIQARQEKARFYNEQLKDFCITPKVLEGNSHVYAQYTLRVQDREQLISSLDSLGIPSGVYYPIPLHLQPVFRYLGYEEGDFPIVEKVSKEVLSLPMHPFLEEEEQELVIQALERAMTATV